MSPTPTLKKVKDTLLVEYVGNGNPAYDPDPLIKKKEAFTARGLYTPSYPLCYQSTGTALLHPSLGDTMSLLQSLQRKLVHIFAVAACSTQLEHAFATIMTSQSGASPAPDPYEVEVAFKIVYESALPINDADSD
ncbi:hypothetical protein BT96DRAFT_1007708 [Gymnopus androsaceus JB14]|uniref:Uncharacterized protein n=1 Tax=Gymnopus androsaceus JB14 TaxID=1447944 RepID=A0A6A4GHE0_9AGAR|nr:hypothetical protein BT96DRAFT_1007708 [Gymnopus androsaceus JB14]